MESIFYKSGYKYQLAEDYFQRGTEIYVEDDEGTFLDIKTQYIELNNLGGLLIKKGFAWDGPSGPTIDTKNFMRGSLVHDALYQLMRKGKLDPFHYRMQADALLRKMCREDGMSWIRAWWIYQSLRQFGYKAATRENQKPVMVAP